MEERIVQLINDSIGSQLYPKAIECLNALRAGDSVAHEDLKTLFAYN